LILPGAYFSHRLKELREQPLCTAILDYDVDHLLKAKIETELVKNRSENGSIRTESHEILGIEGILEKFADNAYVVPFCRRPDHLFLFYPSSLVW
jgi:hypothetical protein